MTRPWKIFAKAKIDALFPKNYFLESLIYQKQGKKQLAKRRMDIGTMYELMYQGHYFLAGVMAEQSDLNEMALNLCTKRWNKSREIGTSIRCGA